MYFDLYIYVIYVYVVLILSKQQWAVWPYILRHNFTH
jgi:hypothetical protein